MFNSTEPVSLPGRKDTATPISYAQDCCEDEIRHGECQACPLEPKVPVNDSPLAPDSKGTAASPTLSCPPETYILNDGETEVLRLCSASFDHKANRCSLGNRTNPTPSLTVISGRAYAWSRFLPTFV